MTMSVGWLLLLLSHAWAEPRLAVVGAVQEDSPVEVQLVDADNRPIVGATLRVLHRPGLPGEVELGLGITDSSGRVAWTPEISGPATLSTRVHHAPVELDVAIARTSWPLNALVPIGLLMFAGLSLMALGVRGRSRPAVRSSHT